MSAGEEQYLDLFFNHHFRQYTYMFADVDQFHCICFTHDLVVNQVILRLAVTLEIKAFWT